MDNLEYFKEKVDDIFKGNPHISSYDTKPHDDTENPDEDNPVIIVGFKYNEFEAEGMGYYRSQSGPQNMAEDFGFPKNIDGVEIKYKFEGRITFDDHDSYFTEIPVGASVGSEKTWDDDSDITGGTLFGPVFDEETGEMYLATNAHVLTNITGDEDQHEIGDIVTQPYSYEEGYDYQIGHLNSIYFDDENADLALIDIDLHDEDREVLYGESVEAGTLAHMPYTGNFEEGDTVAKDGITTGHTEGEIKSTSTTITIDDGTPDGAEFSNVVRTDMHSDFGDSGSRVWHKQSGDTVGIHFAGDDDYAYHCRGDMLKENCGINFDNRPHLNVEIEGEGTVVSESFEGTVEGPGEQTLRTDYGDIEITADADEGYIFDHWSGSALSEDEVSDDISLYMDREHDIKAVFSVAYTLSVNTDGNGSVNISPDKDYYAEGEEVCITAEPEEGWEFAGWQGDITSSNEAETVTINEDTSITAIFEEIPTYSLEIHEDGNGTVNVIPDQGEYEEGTGVEISASTGEEWNFVKWQGDIESTDSTETFVMQEDMEITAVFSEADTYELVVHVSGEGTVDIDPTKEEYNEGEEIALTASPADNYQFAEWQGDIESEEIETTFEIESDTSVTAVFKAVTYSLNIVTDGMGTVDITPDQEEYEHGTAVTLEAEPAEDFNFYKWSGDISSTDPTEVITLEEDMSVTAEFVMEEYKLNVAVDGEGSVEKDPDQETYTYGQTVEITAQPEEKWQFAEWQGDLESENKTETFTIQENLDITAVMQEMVEIEFVVNNLDKEQGKIIAGDNTVEDEESLLFVKDSVIDIKAESIDDCAGFVEWSSSDIAYNIEDMDSKSTELTASSGGSIKAIFKKKILSISVTADGSGSLSIYIDGEKEKEVESNTTVSLEMECGKELEIEAEADEDYSFAEWTGVN